MDNLTETRLGFNNTVGNVHLPAKSRKMKNTFNGLDIMSNYNKKSFLILDEGGNMVET